MWTRTGTAFEKYPTSRSMPVTSALRPDTVVPKARSSCPVRRLSASAQAAWKTTAVGTPSPDASDPIRSAISSVISTVSSPDPDAPPIVPMRKGGVPP